jgi:hypothetical protein
MQVTFTQRVTSLYFFVQSGLLRSMKHYGDDAWADYVRGVSTGAEAAALSRHLADGCEPCRRLMTAMSTVARIAADDAQVTPPDDATHLAYAIVAMRRPDNVRIDPPLVAQLVFDSFRSAAVAGIRSGQTMTRHVLYEAGPYAIDLRLDHARAGRQLSLTGQVVASDAQLRVGGMTVSLIGHGIVNAQTQTNGAGEFQMEYEPRPDLQLRIGVRPDGPIEFPLIDSDGSTGAVRR